MFDLTGLSLLGSIILVDLVLSGDNALVIGAAVTTFPRRQRRMAIVLGACGAILLRILLTSIATFLLQVPFLQMTGGIILLGITVKLLLEKNDQKDTVPENKDSKRGRTHAFLSLFTPSNQFALALLTILLADMTTSLDNIVAIGALAQGNLLILGVGLVLSITFLFIGSTLISFLIRQLQWLLLVAAVILALTAASLILNDRSFNLLFGSSLPAQLLVYGIAIATILFGGYFWLLNHFPKLVKT